MLHKFIDNEVDSVRPTEAALNRIHVLFHTAYVVTFSRRVLLSSHILAKSFTLHILLSINITSKALLSSSAEQH